MNLLSVILAGDVRAALELHRSYLRDMSDTSSEGEEIVLVALTNMNITIESHSRNRNSNQITRISLPWTKFTFTCVDQYVDDYLSFSKEENKRFFPMALNHKSMIYFTFKNS